MDKRLGKQVNKPNPKCPECGVYMKEIRAISYLEWDCHNCGSSYQVKKNGR